MEPENPIVAFARDFSGNDATLVEKVKAFAASPPTTIEQIGFYGAEGYAPNTRLYLGAVNLLDEAGHLQSVEDKYTPEIFQRWQEEGLLKPEALPPAAKALLMPILEGKGFTTEQIVAYYDAAWANYAKATEEIEALLAAQGKVLLSVDATGGDTLFFALVGKEVAERWRDKALSEEAGYRAGVRSPMWGAFWAHLDYGAGFYRLPGNKPDLPPGTKPRDETIPFMK